VKVGFVLDDSLDKTDGVQQYVLTLGNWLHHQGHEVHYLVGQTQRTDLAHVHSLSRNLQVHFNQNRMSTPLPADKAAIRRLLAAEQFDVLHVQMPYSPFLAGRIIRFAPPSTAVIGTFHIIPFSWAERVATKLLGIWLWRRNRRFDAVLSVSAPARRFARRGFFVKSQLLPNVVDVHALETVTKFPRFDDGKLNIVFLGRLVERKGCLYLLQALKRLHDLHQLDRVRVMICGKGPLEQALKTYVKKNHLSSVVHFTGYVSERDKPRYLASADIAVMPSTGGESFGIVLLEAMAAGADVVLGGDNAGYRFVLGERPDLLVDPTDIADFARTLRHFMTSSRARRQAAAWQRAYVQRFDVRLVGMELLGLYRLAVAKHAPNNDNGSK
jgi:phosphatidylinositol alpha-mannosyltransferase